jgi:hypothetical protein
MRPLFAFILSSAPATLIAAQTVASTTPSNGSGLVTRPEATHYEETSRYKDVLDFFNSLEKSSALVRLENFGYTQEGRALPLAIISEPPTSQARDSRDSGKTIVLLLADIHAGEVEGKEAAQIISKRLVNGDLRPLLKRLIVLVVPIYNADGNERISVTNRTEQNGPIGGVGVRENAQRLDLNRDFMKLDSPEARALVGLLNQWDPHISVDLHTTDGSYHGYHLTYSIPLNPATDPALADFHRNKMMPALGNAMLKKHHFRTYYYGNFSTAEAAASSGGGEFRPVPRRPDSTNQAKVWLAFSPQPRVGINYIGLRNRFAILSEAYSYLDFRGRIEVTEAFVEEILRYAYAHDTEIRALTSALDLRTIERGQLTEPFRLGVEFEARPLPKPVEILSGEVTRVKNPRSGADMIAMIEDKVHPAKMRDYGTFAAKRTVPAAPAYLIERESGGDVVLAKLLAHGIAVETLTEPLTMEVQRYMVSKTTRSTRAVQNHFTVKLAGDYKSESKSFPPGTLLVRTAQPLGLLAAYLLEPESDDGLATWGFFDNFIGEGKPFPVSKAMQAPAVAARRLKELKSE